MSDEPLYRHGEYSEFGDGLDNIRDYATALPHGTKASRVVHGLLGFISQLKSALILRQREAWVRGRLEWWDDLQGTTYFLDDQAKEELTRVNKLAEERYPFP